ncbi:MAG: hypothetical protein AB8F78_15430 [Saprospiraceae bacterium]
MNNLGLKCIIRDGKSNLVAIISLENGEIHMHTFKSPSIFSFKSNSGEILNWHRENILSLISNFNIKGISIKKSERESFTGRPKNSDIFKLYLEGVLLSLAGTSGIFNKHYYKNDITYTLENSNIFNCTLEDIATNYNKTLQFGPVNQADKKAIIEALLSVLSLEKELNND